MIPGHQPTRRARAITQPGMAAHTPLFGPHQAHQDPHGCAGLGSPCTGHPDCAYTGCAGHPDQAREGWDGISTSSDTRDASDTRDTHAFSLRGMDYSDHHGPRPMAEYLAERAARMAFWRGWFWGFASLSAVLVLHRAFFS